MTALNQTYSTEYNLQTGPRRLAAGQYSEAIRYAQLRETYITGQGVVNAFLLPPGNIRILRDPSRLSNENTAWAGATTLTIGWAAYTDAFGVAQVASANGLLSIQTMNAAKDVALTLGGTGILYLDFNTQNGLLVTYTLAAVDKAAADIFNLQIAHVPIGYGT